MPLSANTPRRYDDPIQVKKQLPAYQSVTVYEGAAVGEVSGGGYFRGLVGGDNFAGFAERKCDNASGASGDKKIDVIMKGQIEVDVTGVTGVTDYGDTVYASADGTFTKTSSGASSIGKIIRHVSGTKCVVAFEAVSLRSI